MTMLTGPIAQDATGRSHSVLHRLTDHFRRVLAERRARAELRLRRQAFLNLLELDDKTLNDIGFTRYEVEDAAGLPLEVNASLAVREMARQRREREIRAFRRG